LTTPGRFGEQQPYHKDEPIAQLTIPKRPEPFFELATPGIPAEMFNSSTRASS